MKKQTLLNEITDLTNECKVLVENFKTFDDIPQIDIDLSIDKIIKIYDNLLRLRDINKIDEKLDTEIKEEIVVEKIAEEPEPQNDIIESNEEIVEEKPIIEKKESPENEEDNLSTKQSSLFETESGQEKINNNQDVKSAEIAEEEIDNSPKIDIQTDELADDTKETNIVSDNEQTNEQTTTSSEPKLFGDNETKPDEIDNVVNKPYDTDIVKPEEKIIKKNETIGEKLIDNKKTLNDIFSDFKQKKDLATHLQYQPIEDLKTVISLNDKIRFIKELFNSNSEQYALSINKLNSCNNLDEAMEYLNENFEWNDTKTSFKEFLELIYRRFLNITP